MPKHTLQVAAAVRAVLPLVRRSGLAVQAQRSSKAYQCPCHAHSGLTLPSRGHATAGGGSSLCRHWRRRRMPLTSNVRRAKCNVLQSSASARPFGGLRTVGGRSVSALLTSLPSSQRSLSIPTLSGSVTWGRPATAWRRSLPSAVNSSPVSAGLPPMKASRSFGSTVGSASGAARVRELVQPNRAVEWTANGGARLRAAATVVAPLSATHLQR